MERIVAIPDAETRQLEYYSQEPATAYSMLPNGSSYSYQFIENVKQTQQGKVIAVSEHSVCVLTAGRERPFWILKALLRASTTDYVKTLEIESATRMGEYRAPGSEETNKRAGAK